MKRIARSIFVSTVIAWMTAAVAVAPVLAQTSPNLRQGQVPTAAQWNKFFSDKQDVLGYTPLNIAGGVMTGRLTTTASTASAAGFRVVPGTAPSSPTNGDLWATSSGLFVQINGATVGPLISAASSPVSSVSNSDSSLTISPTTGAVIASLNVGHANTWTALQQYAKGMFALKGSTSGTITHNAPAVAGSNTITWPAGTTDFSATGGTAQVLFQTSAGGALTVARPTCSTLSDAATSCATDATNASNISSGTLPSARLSGSYTGITGVGTLTAGATGAGFTVALTTSTITGTIPSANVSGSYTGITGLGTLTAGATGAGFTVALTTSTITGNLPIANAPSVANNTILSNVSGGTAAVAANSITTALDSLLSSTVGSIAIRKKAGTWSVLTPGTDGTVLTAKGAGEDPVYAAASGTGTVTSVGTSGCATGGAITTTGTVAVTAASTTEAWSATSNKCIDAAVLNSAGALTTLTDAATIAVDMATFVNATVTLGGNRTLGAPSNTQVGRTGCIYVVQDGTGSRTLAYNAVWKFAGGTAPTLTTTASAVDMLCYTVRTSSFIVAALTKDVK